MEQPLYASLHDFLVSSIQASQNLAGQGGETLIERLALNNYGCVEDLNCRKLPLWMREIDMIGLIATYYGKRKITNFSKTREGMMVFHNLDNLDLETISFTFFKEAHLPPSCKITRSRYEGSRKELESIKKTVLDTL